MAGYAGDVDRPSRTLADTPSRDQVRRAPKVLLHDHLDGGLRPQTILELAADCGHELPADDAEALGRWFTEAADSGSLVRYLETFDHTVARHADRARAQPGGPRVRRGPRRRRRRLRRGALRPRAARRQRADARRGRRGRPGGLRRGHRGDGRTDRRTPAADRDAPPGPVARDRRARGRVARPRGGRLRHRRRRGGLPADPAPRRVRVPPARELPLHHPRRRGVRAAVDLAGDPVVRRRPARPRRAHHRRHHRGRGRVGRAGPAGGVRPGQADPAGDVPGLQPPDRRRRRRSPSTPSGCSPSCASGSPSTPTTG